MKNLFMNLPEVMTDELVERIAGSEGVRIERIVSYGHSSKEEFWYDQDGDEFVLLLSGWATLEFEGHLKSLKPGDYLTISAHQKHRVKWTSSKEPTIWLAVHYGDREVSPGEKGAGVEGPL